MKNNGLLDSLHITQGLTDYLYYETELDLPNYSTLQFKCRSSAGYVVYVDGVVVEEFSDRNHYETEVTFKTVLPYSGVHNVSIVVEMFGISDAIAPGHGKVAGGISKVTLNNGDISKNKWLHKSYLYGEVKKYYTLEGSQSVKWEPYVKSDQKASKWYKTTFDLPTIPTDAQIVYDVEGLGRGHAYINGRDVGRYWNVKYNSEIYTQRYYHIPKDWLKAVNCFLT